MMTSHLLSSIVSISITNRYMVKINKNKFENESSKRDQVGVCFVLEDILITLLDLCRFILCVCHSFSSFFVAILYLCIKDMRSDEM